MNAPSLKFVGRVRRGSVFALSTPHKELQLYISETGRSVRVFDPQAKDDNGKKGRELK